MDATPKRHNLTIDPCTEGVCLDLGVGQIHLRFKRHGKKHLTVDWEQVGSSLVVTKTRDPEHAAKK